MEVEIDDFVLSLDSKSCLPNPPAFCWMPSAIDHTKCAICWVGYYEDNGECKLCQLSYENS